MLKVKRNLILSNETGNKQSLNEQVYTLTCSKIQTLLEYYTATLSDQVWNMPV